MIQTIEDIFSLFTLERYTEVFRYLEKNDSFEHSSDDISSMFSMFITGKYYSFDLRLLIDYLEYLKYYDEESFYYYLDKFKRIDRNRYNDLIRIMFYNKFTSDDLTEIMEHHLF